MGFLGASYEVLARYLAQLVGLGLVQRSEARLGCAPASQVEGQLVLAAPSLTGWPAKPTGELAAPSLTGQPSRLARNSLEFLGIPENSKDFTGISLGLEGF